MNVKSPFQNLLQYLHKSQQKLRHEKKEMKLSEAQSIIDYENILEQVPEA